MIGYGRIAALILGPLILAALQAPETCRANVADCPEPYTLAWKIDEDALIPAAELVAAVDFDLNAVRTAYPYFGDLYARNVWEPGTVLARMTAETFAEFLAGTYTGLDSLNEYYDCVGMVVGIESMHIILLHFDLCYNIDLLAGIYAQHPDLHYAEPNYYIGDGDDIRAEQVGVYAFRRGWGDCPSGCAYEHIWKFAVVDGVVIYLDDWGDPISDAPQILPVGSIHLAQNYPNPFNPRTEIIFELDAGGSVDLAVHDLSGRRVCVLLDAAFHAAGRHAHSWDGRDARGRQVPAGVYFLHLRAASELAVRKITLLK